MKTLDEMLDEFLAEQEDEAASQKTPEQIRREVIDDLVNSCLNDSSFLQAIIEDHVSQYTEYEIHQMWFDAGLDGRENDDE